MIYRYISCFRSSHQGGVTLWIGKIWSAGLNHSVEFASDGTISNDFIKSIMIQNNLFAGPVPCLFRLNKCSGLQRDNIFCHLHVFFFSCFYMFLYKHKEFSTRNIVLHDVNINRNESIRIICYISLRIRVSTYIHNATCYHSHAFNP